MGTIDGRIHGQDHAKIWIGDRKKNSRIVVQWKPVRKEMKIIKKKVKIGQRVDNEGFYQPIFKEIKKKIETTKFAPDTKQKELFEGLDKNPGNIYNFIVDTKNRELVKKKIEVKKKS